MCWSWGSFLLFHLVVHPFYSVLISTDRWTVILHVLSVSIAVIPFCFFISKPVQHTCCISVMPSLPLGNIHSQLFTPEQVWTALIKMKHWIWLWPRDIKISLDLANEDYSASLPQREATAQSMPCNPLHSTSLGRIYGSADGPMLNVAVSVADYRMHKWWLRGCQERC